MAPSFMRGTAPDELICTEALIFFAKKREKVWLNEKKAVPLHPEIKN